MKTNVNINDYMFDIYLDKPLSYKDLILYPATMSDWKDFYMCYGILQIDKDSQGPEIAALSYLDFIIFLTMFDKRYQDMFYTIMKICIGEDVDIDFFRDEDKNKNYIRINGHQYDKYDFDNIIKLINYQNDFRFDDTYIDPTLKKALEEERELKAKKATPTTLEEQIIAVMVSTGMSMDTIRSMTIRKFSLCYIKSIERLDYQIAKTAELNGTKFKETIVDWVPFSKNLNIAKRVEEYNSLKSKIGASYK